LKRETIVVGRLGTVIVSIGLALLLVSLIPSYASTTFGGSEQVPSATFQPLGMVPFGNLPPNVTFYGGYFSILTPQQELNVKLTCNGTVNAYLLKMDLNSVLQALNSSGGSHNASFLEDYLKANPEAIAWQGQVTDGTVDFTPTAIINASLIFSNPTQNTIQVQYDGKILNLLAPANKARTISFGAIPIGFVLTLPWLIYLRRRRNNKTP
jgi:hypothetical protein